MTKTISLAIAAALTAAAAPSPALAQAANFTLVNGTDVDMTQLAVCRFGTQQWVPLVVAPLPVAKSGGRGSVTFEDQDCAFDLRATLPDGKVMVWPGVNLCEVKVVTLRRTANGQIWADYR